MAATVAMVVMVGTAAVAMGVQRLHTHSPPLEAWRTAGAAAQGRWLADVLVAAAAVVAARRCAAAARRPGAVPAPAPFGEAGWRRGRGR